MRMEQSMQQIWDDLAKAHTAEADRQIAALITDSGRMARFTLRACGMLLDLSRTSIDSREWRLLLSLAAASGLEARRDAMFSGAPVNTTENRAALHMALRSSAEDIRVDGHNIMPDIGNTLRRMRNFANAVRKGDYWVSGNAVRDVVSIGMGGSDLGPSMAASALAPWADGPSVHFVSNGDGADLHDLLADLDPATTLFIIVSKSFTTAETMANASAARAWLDGRVSEPARHFAAVSCALDRTAKFGILDERVFGFEDWVGGRFSVWGPVGLALMIAIGPEAFDDFRAGAAAMDQHFSTAPLAENMPVWLALAGIWHHQICGHPTRAVVPYAQRLKELPAYLQQLEMESNGKRVTIDGAPLGRVSAPVVWGGVGTNAQHAFFQMFHQGTQTVPCEFLLFAKGVNAGDDECQQALLANGLAQAQTLMQGCRDAGDDICGDLGAHRYLPGNRPSVTLAARILDPWVLGAILALYEHRVFVEGTILGINSFDQWGVEKGKQLAREIMPLLMGADISGQNYDPATLHMAEVLRDMAAD